MFSWSIRARCAPLAVVIFATLCESAPAQQIQRAGAASALPRTADGKPNLQGIWQVRSTAASDLQDHAARPGMPAGKGVVEGGEIPYQPSAAARKLENFTNRQTADPLGKCYMPGVPRIMYMEYPFQIFQTPEHIAITFEWSQVYRLIYLNGKPPLHDVVDSWMGDSRARWEGDTLVVDTVALRDDTFIEGFTPHSDAMTVHERIRFKEPGLLEDRITVIDPKALTKPWETVKTYRKASREKGNDELREFACAEGLAEAK